MNDTREIFHYTVGELIEILKGYPEEIPVVVSGYESGYENFYAPFVKKVKHLPENPYYEGQFQIDEASDNQSIKVLILEREIRDD